MFCITGPINTQTSPWFPWFVNRSKPSWQTMRKCTVHKTWEEHVSPLFFAQYQGRNWRKCISLKAFATSRSRFCLIKNPSSLFQSPIEASPADFRTSKHCLASSSLNSWFKGKFSSALRDARRYQKPSKNIPSFCAFHLFFCPASPLAKDEDTPVLLILTVEGGVRRTKSWLQLHRIWTPPKLGYGTPTRSWSMIYGLVYLGLKREYPPHFPLDCDDFPYQNGLLWLSPDFQTIPNPHITSAFFPPSGWVIAGLEVVDLQ